MFDTTAERFVLQDYDLPPLGPGDVQVRIELAAPKHGTESHIWSGNVNRGRRWDPALRMFLDPPPGDAPSRPALMRVGNMAVGVVEEVGTGPASAAGARAQAQPERAGERNAVERSPAARSGAAPEGRSSRTAEAVAPQGVEEIRPGDRVYGYMPVREVHQTSSARLRPLAGGLTPEAAVCIDPAHVAFVAVRDGKVRLGDRVAVFGLGAIGLLTVQAARASGAERVVAIDPLVTRRERALRMGADAAFDPAAGDVALAIKEATERRGVDVAIETSGADRALHEAIRCITQCGTVVAVGWGSGTGAGLYLGEEFHVNRPTIVASQASSYWGNPDRDHPLWDERRAQEACAELFRRGKLSPQGILDPVVDLDEAPEVLQAVRHDPERVLKIGIRLRD
jgi:threonine dehydrogenase-like Zn-dependent dehydrogenase